MGDEYPLLITVYDCGPGEGVNGRPFTLTVPGLGELSQSSGRGLLLPPPAVAPIVPNCTFPLASPLAGTDTSPFADPLASVVTSPFVFCCMPAETAPIGCVAALGECSRGSDLTMSTSSRYIMSCFRSMAGGKGAGSSCYMWRGVVRGLLPAGAEARHTTAI